ncbi:O-antigen ligase family protein [Zeaxanthinibacter sp. PT1]|uniref:O-antigen ligase family protein n=1 Tax=Zeaxanthinibacter TaxID=561554 RepID=UPI00234BD89B|nr:O-antigen ligase family protein [Zeaxanthinibacter sp. PT1]MDC6350611.1 O-antigen ligase family protein [Zeaxanthinibacter sp. PT1]
MKRLVDFGINTDRLYFSGVLVYVFLIPFEQKWATWAILLWAVLSLSSFQQYKPKMHWGLILLPALYLVYAVGLFLTFNGELKYLEHKLSLLIFPVLFYLHRFTKEDYILLMKVFLWGLLVSGICCLLIAVYRSIEIGPGIFRFQPELIEGKSFMESVIYGGNYFFGKHFSVFHQTVYFGLYLTVGTSILLFQKNLFPIKQRVVFILFFALLLFLISNKASLIVLTILLIYRVLIIRTSALYKIIFLGCLALGIYTLSLFNPRVSESVGKVVKNEFTLDKEARYGYATRLLSWDASLDLISENPFFGYGVGNAQAALNQKYIEKEYRFPLRDELNSHNQFFQTWIENGIFGLFLLVAIFLMLFKRAYSYTGTDKYLALAIVLIFFINALFESILNRFSGISFFAFLSSLIFATRKAIKN